MFTVCHSMIGGTHVEYDVYVKISSADVHKLGYILEVEDNLVNLRKHQDGVLRMLVTADLKDELLELLDSLKEELNFEVLSCEVNSGSA